MMTEQDLIRPGDRVQVRLKAETFGQEGWFDGTVVRIDPYSAHRSFHWVELDAEAQAILGGGMKLVSVLNPRNIRKV
jgi:predicted DsbA family dithiol-disulfide isomerase